ncbi:hypothetical protein [Polaromonas sp.]|uniref:hypothetical protein n=1 Tax=Polaromonas sp. TaxID=1869339 RepID=UPI0027366506|nr:hypothetical protein [Polaromonas sp.]MDP3755318.1 hypothetical protein [Polaromonas sp.]
MAHFDVLDVLDNSKDGDFLPGPSRILDIQPAENRVLLIELRGLEEKSSAGEKVARDKETEPDNQRSLAEKNSNRMRDYVRGPFKKKLNELNKACETGRVYKANILDSHPSLPEEMWLSSQLTEEKRLVIENMIKGRNSRIETLGSLIRFDPLAKDSRLLTPAELLRDPNLPKKILMRATELGKGKNAIYHPLHLLWAGGNQLNALCTRNDRIGNPGLEKPQINPLGRKPRPTEAGLSSQQPFVLTKGAKLHFLHGYRLISLGSTAKDAYHDYCNHYYADHLVGPDGALVPELWPKADRPSFDQFMAWGARSAGDIKVQEIRDGPVKTEQMRSRGGSLQDKVSGAGGRGGFDGTSTDVYLSSVTSRLKKLPAATRLILRETSLDLIIGWDISWNAPSPRTALKAIFMGASSKVEHFKRYGIEVTDDQFANILIRSIDVDNGELKAQAATDAEVQFGFQLQYRPKGRSDWNGGVESGHHSDHKAVDHKLPGTTKGRRRNRGDPHPADGILLNRYEYMREWLRHVLRHNHKEVPHLRPVDMALQDPTILPTRINIFNWMKSHHMTADLPKDPEKMRAYMLPAVDATITGNGLYLSVMVLGRKTILWRLRYSSTDKTALDLMSLAKRTGKVLPIQAYMDTEELKRLWVPTKDGLKEWKNAAKETTLLEKFSLQEYIEYVAGETLTADFAADEVASASSKVVHDRTVVRAKAKSEFDAELRLHKTPPSKTKLRQRIRENKVEEQKLMDQEDGALLRAGKGERIPIPRNSVSEVAGADLSLAAPVVPRRLSADELAMRGAR